MIESISELSDLKLLTESIVSEVRKTIIGLDDYVKTLTFCLLSGGHVLLDGLPGTAKTALALSFSNSLALDIKRIQSTPDMMPGDVTGTRIYNPKTLEFEFRSGPVFSNIVVVDEINRAPPRSQAALLEAMQEGQVTVDGVTSVLDQPFMIVATKNPIEFAGTFPLPPAQLDRFMARLIMNYPPKESWVDVLEKKNERGETVNVNPVLNQSAVLSAQKIIQNQITVSDDVLSYIADFCRTTRDSNRIILGASPTATVSLLSAARGYAAVVHGRDHVTIDDVKDVSFDVLNHRLIIRELQAETETKDYGVNQIQEILTSTMEAIK